MKKLILTMVFVFSVNFFSNAESNFEENYYPDDCMDLLYGFINEFDSDHPGQELTDLEIQWLSYDLCDW